MVTITYFVHGTTTDNEKKLATGWLPGELSETGKQQARELGKQVADQIFDALFCSDLERAIASAKLGFGDTYQAIQDERLRECNYGDLNGEDESVVKTNMAAHIARPFPNGESYKDAQKRLASFVAFLQENYTGNHIAIKAHQGPQLALDVVLRGRTWRQAIDEDWRKRKAWQSGWEYKVE